MDTTNPKYFRLRSLGPRKYLSEDKLASLLTILDKMAQDIDFLTMEKNHSMGYLAPATAYRRRQLMWRYTALARKYTYPIELILSGVLPRQTDLSRSLAINWADWDAAEDWLILAEPLPKVYAERRYPIYWQETRLRCCVDVDVALHPEVRKEVAHIEPHAGF